MHALLAEAEAQAKATLVAALHPGARLSWRQITG
jgi:hypothetical protein